jgi:hypothetical protein
LLRAFSFAAIFYLPRRIFSSSSFNLSSRSLISF